MRNHRIITGGVVEGTVCLPAPPVISHNFISFNNISNNLRCLYAKPPYNNRRCG